MREIVAAITAGQPIAHELLGRLSATERAELDEALLGSSAGRRWLRASPSLDADLADTLLQYGDDFRTQRRDASLNAAVERASHAALHAHATLLAASPAAPALWRRLAGDPPALEATALDVIRRGDVAAAEATLYHLVVDPLDPHGLGAPARTRIAEAALVSPAPVVRGAAAEFLAEQAPEALLTHFDSLSHDPDERVRGSLWACALRVARVDARELAFALIGDEHAPLEARRSALIAAGLNLPTSDLVDLLSVLVGHPSEELALDAALLLHDYHRHPTIATAAQASPHLPVREIAERLLDPLRGSPAAGGSRPGDPTRPGVTDIFSDMLRQVEERAAAASAPEDACDRAR
jgi:hypothetical protein